MSACERARIAMQLYVDGELESAEQLILEAHLLECDSCRSEYTELRQIVDSVRGASPLYPASTSLRRKLTAIVNQHRSMHARRVRIRVGAMAAAFAVTLVGIAFLPSIRTERFTSFAADTHSRYANDAVALGVLSQEPSVVSDWLHERLPFHLSLPNFPAQSGQMKNYSLVGASRMHFDGQDVAYLAYTMEGRPISLLVSSSANVLPSSGQAYTSGKLTFHFSSERGLKLITWRDRGLSYALVSDVQVEGAESCVVCHGAESEREKFENLLRR
jgi:anti-sigma factor RsiW